MGQPIKGASTRAAYHLDELPNRPDNHRDALPGNLFDQLPTTPMTYERPVVHHITGRGAAAFRRSLGSGHGDEGAGTKGLVC